MTLAPVFRSPQAVKALQEKGYWHRLEPSLAAHREAKSILNGLLEEVINTRYLQASPRPDDELRFLQENFFLILFHSVFETLGCEAERLDCYTLLNYCIRGIVLSGDNLFDEEEKLVLPLALSQGKRFKSIVQMMCFQGLVRRVLARHGNWLTEEEKVRFQRDLLDALTAIGTLEGSEEAGVESIPTVAEMIESVHRVRGGSLFSLAFVAPRVGERGADRDKWHKAETGIGHLGTAFQIVDDLTDLEFDLGRRSHNLLAAQITHHGTAEERRLLARLLDDHKARLEGGWVEKGLQESASVVLSLTRREAEKAFELLKALGFWFPPEDSLLFVRAIAGDAGFKRVQGLEVS